MTRLIGAFIIILVIVAGWKLVVYYQRYGEESELQKRAETGADIQPERLEGLPYALNQSLGLAQKNGPAAFREWLKTYSPHLKDPRKAWIELDYCVAIIRDDPNEARRVFQGVKNRTSTNSPVYPRIRQLQGTFE